MKNILEYILFSLFSHIFCLFGFKRAHLFAPFLTYVFYDILKLRRKVVLKNLSIAFPELGAEARENLARDCYLSSAKTFIEIMALPSLKYEEIEHYFDQSSIEMALNAYNKGKGVVLMTAHFGNWEIAALGYARKLGIPFSTLAQPQRNHFVTCWMERERTKWGNRVYKTGHAAMTLYKALINGEIIAVVADQRGAEDGLRVPFFGVMSAVNEGSAALAIKTGAPIIFCIMIRQPDNSYKMETREISFDNLPDTKEGKIAEISRRHTAVLEEYIRSYPEMWFWMHNRWKY